MVGTVKPDERTTTLFYLRYIASELRRRRGRTILTALGLGVGVGLVVTVVALSHGLDRAQSKVLEPLTGVGTDLSVQRPIVVSGSGENQSFAPGQPGSPSGGPPQLSAKEQRELQRENGGARIGLQNAGKPGQHFDRTDFMSSNLSFPEGEAKKVNSIAGVEGTAGTLTLSMIHASGKIPKSSGQAQFAGPPQAGSPNAINIEQSTVSGVDASRSGLGLITPSQISKGHYLAQGKRFQAVLSQAYADQQNLSVGDSVEVGNKEFGVVGIATPPLGGQSSDIYVPLDELQRLSHRVGRINVLQVRADSADQVERRRRVRSRARSPARR